MSKTILVEKQCFSTKVMILNEEEWTHYYIDTPLDDDLQNKIFVGQVSQVVKNLKAVFIDFGLDKKGFLPFNQIPEAYQNKVQIGSRIPVQITKQNVGDKGHKLTSKINLLGKYVVCLPFEEGISISKKINIPEQRQYLKTLVESLNTSKYGFVVRTRAIEVDEHSLIEDIKTVLETANHFMSTKDMFTKGTLLYSEPSTALQAIEEHLGGGETVEIICDDAKYLESLKKYFSPVHYPNVTYQLYTDVLPLASVYSLSKKLEQLNNRKIWLKSGGNLVIDYTEAMTIIDVNSAKAILTKNHAKAVCELNKQAVRESLLQILRRNLSGMIIVDLVEMPTTQMRQEVFEYAKSLLGIFQDKKTKVYPITELGLLQISRSKKYQMLPHILGSNCPTCAMSYAMPSHFSALLALENIIKDIAIKTIHNTICIEAKSDFYIYLIENEVIDLLRDHYHLSINLKKNGNPTNKAFLCQFY